MNKHIGSSFDHNIVRAGNEASSKRMLIHPQQGLF